jgi:hypothetical protein
MVTPTAPYLQITTQNLFGATLVTINGCPSATSTLQCQQLALLEEPIDNGWRGETSVASGGGTTGCFLSYTLATAILTDTTIQVESTLYEDTVPNLDATSCTAKEATNRGTSMPCKEHFLITAPRL